MAVPHRLTQMQLLNLSHPNHLKHRRHLTPLARLR